MQIVKKKKYIKIFCVILVCDMGMISVKTSEEIQIMREGGRRLWNILQALLKEAQADVSLQTLEKHAQEYIKSQEGIPSFKTVRGYQWATCLCLNEQVVHGIPSSYILKEGDFLTIDIGMVYKGFHTDTAWTKIIYQKTKANKQKTDEGKERFLKIGEETLQKAIGAAKAGNRVGHISQIIEQTITGAGYDVVRSLTGHGIGRKLHEEPMIPEYLDKPIERTALLSCGMTLAIEVIYAMGKGGIIYSNDDGWTLSSKDKSLTAVFEQTIAVRGKDSAVLTGS